MSHYSSNSNSGGGGGGGSWQSHPNSNSGSSSHHDMTQSKSGSSSSSSNIYSGGQSSTAASLLAQFAAGSVHLSNLAANLPALVNPNAVLQSFQQQNSVSGFNSSASSNDPRPLMESFDMLARLGGGNSNSASGGGSNRHSNGTSNNARFSNHHHNQSSSSTSVSSTPAPALTQALINQIAGAVQSNAANGANNPLAAAVALMRNNSAGVNKPQQQQSHSQNHKNASQQKNSSTSQSHQNNRQHQHQNKKQANNNANRNNNTNNDNGDRASALTRIRTVSSTGSDRRLVIDDSPNRGKPPAAGNQKTTPNKGKASNSGADSAATATAPKPKPPAPLNTAAKKAEPSTSSTSGPGKRSSPSRSPSSAKRPNHGGNTSAGHHGGKSALLTSSASSRYSVRIPKYSLDSLVNNASGLKGRYAELYIPSDFTNVKNTWQTSLALNRSLKFTNRCLFHVMRKEAVSIDPLIPSIDPSDADHTWNVKVMLMAMPNVQELIKRCCNLTEDTGSKDERYEHPSKVIQFLVGSKSKQELMAIGGPWSPSLDGENPAKNTQTLINTAIRTTKALTGIDLSPCTQWYRFVEIQYNRNPDFRANVVSRTAEKDDAAESAATSEAANSEETPPQKTTKSFDINTNLNDESYVEHTVIFLPNVWSLMPNSVEYKSMAEAYKNFVDNPPPKSESQSAQVLPEEAKSQDVTDASSKLVVKESTTTEGGGESASAKAAKPADGPAHYSQIDLSKMEEAEIRSQLETRGLDTSGATKDELTSRLKEALDKEKEVDTSQSELVLDAREEECMNNQSNGNDSANQMMDSVTIGDEDYLQLDVMTDESKSTTQGKKPAATASQSDEVAKQKEAAAQRAERERLYRLPASPHIIVHPSATAKAGKFDCQLVSLAHLLDYDRKDNKESTFEVSLFAEYFNEMLTRDFAFAIFKSLMALPNEKNKDQIAASLVSSNKRKLSGGGGADSAALVDLTAAEPTDSKRVKHEAASSTTFGSRKDAHDTTSATADSKDKTASSTSASASTAFKGGKMKTVNAELLLAFLFFDQTRCGHLYERDLEDLLLSVGLSLTRSKVKGLLSRLALKDGQLSYRTLTDRPVELASSYRNSLITSSSITDVISLHGRQVEVNVKLPSDDDIVASILSYDSYVSRAGSKAAAQHGGKKETSSSSTSAAALLEIDGITVDVPKTLKKLETSELRAMELESKLKEARDELERVKNANKNLEKTKTRQLDEINDLKKSLKDSSKQVRDAEDKYTKAKDLLSRSRSQAGKLYDELSDFLKRPAAAAAAATTLTTASATTSSNQNGANAKPGTKMNGAQSASNSTSTSKEPTTSKPEPAAKVDTAKSDKVEESVTKPAVEVAKTSNQAQDLQDDQAAGLVLDEELLLIVE